MRFALRLALGVLGEVRVVGVCPQLLDALFVLAFAHRLFKALDGRTQVRPDGTQLFGAEDQQDDEKNDDQLAHPDTH